MPHSTDPSLPLNDLNAFYRQFTKRSELTRDDLDARLELPPIARYFRIHRTEYAIRVIGQELPPNRYNFYFLSLVRTGSATKTDGMNTYAIRPHTLWSTPLGQIHSARDWTADATGYYLSFSPDYVAHEPTLHRLMQTLPFFRFGERHHLYLTEAQSDDLYGIFRCIEREFDGPDDAQRDALIRLYLTEILLKAERLLPAQLGRDAGPVAPSKSLSDRFKDLVEQYYQQQKGIPFYADQLSVHPNYLSTAVKTETGATPGDLIHDRVVQEAKYLLFQSGFSTKEIAYYLGFDDASYFSKYFKKATGQSPGEYQAWVNRKA